MCTPIWIQFMPLQWVSLLSILESNRLVLTIYISMYVFFFSKCVVIRPLWLDYTIAFLS